MPSLRIAPLLTLLLVSVATDAAAQYGYPMPAVYASPAGGYAACHAGGAYAASYYNAVVPASYAMAETGRTGRRACSPRSCGAYAGPTDGWFGAGPSESIWKFRGGAIALQRDRPDPVEIIASTDIIDPIGPVVNVLPSVDASLFDFDFEIGWEASAQAALDDGFFIEVRYFEVEELTDRITLGPRDGHGIIVADDNVFGLPLSLVGPVTGTFDFQTEIRSVEANFRSGDDWLQLLIGFRHFAVEEDILFAVTDGTNSNSVFYGTDNDLYGVQVGAEIIIDIDDWPIRVDLVAKGGVYYNDITTTNGNVSTFSPNSSNLLEASQASSSIELGALVNYPITPKLFVRGGAHILWLNNVAVATDQPSANGLPDTDGLTVVDSTGTPFYTSIFAGLELIP
ncbi:MAG: hypothetical protein DWQ31_00840 [Planctomycetota bacterium]|nr:MAG: hypothetical protein DWQ31_00840 [Planctomycetota bacterium]REJ92667.1 MAG: hypothetical protein DWQ35_11525 [Planctomycetota bacterium]REK23703.1 MAG: hypothetical protein DWQ42_14495 [Planctomycetota bacterium]REK47557.1 MAG: hypothetical protein DWQ46_03775 [Planctomycetota bacterium]